MSDDLLTSGGPAVRFDNVGDTFEGTILSVNKMQDREPSPSPGVQGALKTWPDGTPKNVWILNCEPKGGGEEVSVWVRGNMVKAFRLAARDAKVKELEGCEVKVQHNELGKPKGSFAPAKLFRVKITPGVPKAAASAAFTDDEEPF